MKTPVTHRPGHVYRLCRVCGNEWNVSSKEPGDRVYICPKCRAKKKESEK